jgi:hypothetical protein
MAANEVRSRWVLWASASSARFENVVRWPGLADEPVDAAPLDARLRQRPVRRLVRGVGVLATELLVLT